MATSTDNSAKYPLLSGHIDEVDLSKIPSQLHQLIEAVGEFGDVKYSQDLIPPGYYHVDDPSCPGPMGPCGYEGPGRSYGEVRRDWYPLDMLEFTVLFTIKCSEEQKAHLEGKESQFKLKPSGSNYGLTAHPYKVLSMTPVKEIHPVAYGLYGLPGYLKFVEAQRERLNNPELSVPDALEDNRDENGFDFGAKYYDPYWCVDLPISSGNPQMRIHEAGTVEKPTATKITDINRVRLLINGVDLEENLDQLIALTNELSNFRLSGSQGR